MIDIQGCFIDATNASKRFNLPADIQEAIAEENIAIKDCHIFFRDGQLVVEGLGTWARIRRYCRRLRAAF